MTENNYTYVPLTEPIPISKQKWPEGTTPLVSTSTLTYNHEPFIRDCLDGVLMQETTFPVRIVVFDDCSTDGTREIVKEYKEKFPNLFVTVLPHQNTYGRPERREALKPYFEARAVAKYIALCEGDDYWTDPLKLQKQVDFLEENEEYSEVVSAVKIYNQKTGEFEEKLRIPKGVSIEKDGYTYNLMDTLSGWITETASLVFRNIPEVQNELKSYVNGRDMTLHYVLLKQGLGFYFTDFTAVYRKHSGGIFSGNTIYNNINVAYKTYKELYFKNKDEFTRRVYLSYSLSLFNKGLYEGRGNISFRDNLILLFEACKLLRTPSEIKSFIGSFFPNRLKQKIRLWISSESA